MAASARAMAGAGIRNAGHDNRNFRNRHDLKR